MPTPTIQQMRATIERAYKTDLSDKPDAFVIGFFETSCRNGIRLDAAGNVIGDPDAGDLAHRTARGANIRVRAPNEMPDLASMDLRAVKAVALAIGSYSDAIRAELASALLDRLRELGADQVADRFAAAWDLGDLEAPSDDEDERAGDAHRDSEPTRCAQPTTFSGRGRSKADVLAAMSPLAAKRRGR
jgi:hypothetical protein